VLGQPARVAAVRPDRLGRRRRWLAVAALVVAGAIAAAVELATDGSSPPKDGAPTRGEQAALTVSGRDILVASPRGRVLTVTAGSLEPQRQLIGTFPGLHGIGSSGALVFATDRSNLVVLRAGSGLQRMLSLEDGAFVAGGDGAPVVVAAASARGGRLCELGPNGGFVACLPLGFRPTGLGVSPTRLVFASDERGYLQVFRASGRRLLPAGALSVGANPHGIFVPSRGRLYVPVERGVAVVDALGRNRLRVIHLPVTPAAIWASPYSGRLFAALYATNQVADVDTTTESAATKLLANYERPVAVWGDAATNSVYVLGGGTVCKLDALTGTRRRCATLPDA
jgi:hypothetical protein